MLWLRHPSWAIRNCVEDRILNLLELARRTPDMCGRLVHEEAAKLFRRAGEIEKIYGMKMAEDLIEK